jgi:hypothetical protein
LLLFSSSLYPLSFGCFDILYTCCMVCFIPCFYLSTNLFFLILCTCFWVWSKKHGPLVFWELFLLFVGSSFSFPSIVCMHLNLSQEAWAPCLLGVLKKNCWLFFLMFSYIVYMFTKISFIQWLTSSGGLVFRKKLCNLDAVPIMACNFKSNMLRFWT